MNMYKALIPSAALAIIVFTGCTEQSSSVEASSLTATSDTSRSFFDTSQLKGPAAGEPNQVMVLGTTHLRGMPDTFDPDTLGPLIDRLAGWQPDRIAVESQPGPLCHYMRTFKSRHERSIEFYCFDQAEVAEITGLSVPAAIAELDERLSDGMSDPTPAERRHNVTLFLAAGEKPSAMAHWLALPKEERIANDDFDARLVEIVEELLARGDETSLISAPLAARLGHSNITPVDNQATHMNSPSEYTREASGAAIEAAWDNEACAIRLPAYDEASAGATSTAGVLELYRVMNAPEQAQLAYECDFQAAMDEPSEEAFGRRYLAYWETRNLRMAANIREAMGEDPGSKTLVIVGASHKFYLEHYLDQMHDVVVVNTDVVLKRED